MAEDPVTAFRNVPTEVIPGGPEVLASGSPGEVPAASLGRSNLNALLELGGSRDLLAVDAKCLLQNASVSEPGVGPTKRRRQLFLAVGLLAVSVASMALRPSVSSHLRRPKRYLLQGAVPRDSPDFTHYIGGFCFGHFVGPVKRKVGGIAFNLTRVLDDPQAPIGNGTLYLLSYHDGDNSWGKARSRWNTSSVAELQQWAVRTQPFRSADILTKGYARIRVGITERFDRQWHFVLAGQGVLTNFNVHYQLEGVSALSQWSPGETTPKNCPSQPLQILRDLLVNGAEAYGA
jgi:hypothetical protein